MKNLGKRLVMVAMVFGMTTAMAQKGGEKVKLTPEQKIDKKIEKLDQELGLDAKQKESIKALSLKQMKERDVLKKEMKVVKEKMKVQRKGHKKELKALLTPEQVAKMEELEKEKKAKHAEQKKKKTEHKSKD